MSGLDKEQPKNAIEIIKDYLERNGFDGLYTPGECGCCLDDLIPCDEDPSRCLPGYKKDCGTGEWDFLIGPREDKPE
jgi:hypothetical protein